MAGKYIYRDYRPGRKGKFASKAAWDKSKLVHREKVSVHAISSVDDLLDFEDYPDDELYDYEFHGTADTGKGKRR